MADNTIIDIAEFLSYRGLPYPLLPTPRVSDEAGNRINFDKPNRLAKKNYGASDILGRPIFQPVKIKKRNLPNAVITISIQKKIISTPVTGKRGSIKELVNSEDYKISIKGIIVNQKNEYPSDEVEKLHNLFLKKEALEIENEICELLGITNVVITSFSLPNTGKTNVAAYQFSLLSDDDYTLELE